MDFKDQIVQLLNQISDDFEPPLAATIDIPAYADKMVEKSTIFSIIESGLLIGMMSVYCNDIEKKIAFGTMLAVAKGHRVYGVGPNLIKMTLDYLRKYGFEKFSLEIYKTNPRVITLYKRMGFTQAKESEHSVFVEKLLKDN